MSSNYQDSYSGGGTFERYEAAARMIRAKIGCFDDEPVPSISAALGHLELSCVVRNLDEMGDRLAFAKPQDGEIHFRHDVVMDILDDKPSARFIAFHEVAHAYWHDGKTPHFKMAGGNVLIPFLARDETAEEQADRIADATLMPIGMVRSARSAKELAELARAPIERALKRFQLVVSRGARTTPADVRIKIENQKQSAKTWNTRPGLSQLSSEQQLKLAWETASHVDSKDPAEYRAVDNRWTIRWSKRDKSSIGGWRVKNGKIIVWEDESTR